MIKKRSYQQYCPLATGLDIIGQRWTLLIIRELLIAPKRYKALLENLPGMGTNLLAERLKTLMNLGLIEQIVELTPRVSKVYQLTDLGQELEKPVLALTQWGSQFLKKKQPKFLFRPEWILIVIKAAFNPQKAAYLNICCEWHVDGLIFYIRVGEGRLEIRLGAAENPVATVKTDGPNFLAVVLGESRLKDTIVNGAFKITGSGLAVVRIMQILCIKDSHTQSETP